eukprot:1061911-Pyramimonas_sp.AAC.1
MASTQVRGFVDYVVKAAVRCEPSDADGRPSQILERLGGLAVQHSVLGGGALDARDLRTLRD